MFWQIEGRVDLATALLARGSDLEGRLTGNDLALNCFKNMTNIVCAMLFDRGEMIRMLLSRGANPHVRMSGMHAFVSAYGRLSAANLEMLQELAPHSVEIVGIPFLGCRILTNPFYGGRADAIEWIMAKFPVGARRETGWPMASCCIMQHGEPDALSTALASANLM